MKRILFQGDSITDANRSRENNGDRGRGYPTLLAAKMGYDYPGEYEFFNRGIGGNRVSDLLAKVKIDTINLKPDVLSILVGVNDALLEFSDQNGVRAELYEELYNLLISEIKAALPHIRIMILEPFVLHGIQTDKYWEEGSAEVYLRAAAARRVAEKNDLEFIPLQAKFEEALEKAPSEYWLFDGVHPTSAGHELIARAWLEAFEKL